MDDGLLLTFNAGSSTIKIGIYELLPGTVKRIARGVVDFRDEPFEFRLDNNGETSRVSLRALADNGPDEAIGETFDWLEHHFDFSRVRAIGHRVVHGGSLFSGPVAINDGVQAQIAGLSELAPLHQPQSLRLVRAIRRLYPDIRQTASFDTAFHAGADPLARRMAIPRELHERGIRRYGFHGLSYRSIAGQLRHVAPETATGRVVAAHLGSGASLCGMMNGESRDTSMGFSTLDGIPMATRCGALDPGVVLHLLGPLGYSVGEVEDLLYHRCGLLGVSGFEADSRELLASERAEAREAIDLFVFRIAGEVARIAATLGGLDGLVFSAGIGEHQPEIRARVCERLEWLGVRVDPAANLASHTSISAADSKVGVFVIPTDEEQVIADEACEVLRG